MKVGDLVKMDFIAWTDKDQWGPGIVVCIENNGYDTDEVEVLWSKLGLEPVNVFNAGGDQ